MSVYRGYDAAGLEKQYNARASIPDHPEIFARWARDSAAARARLKPRLDVPYDDGPMEKLDIFAPDAGRPGRPAPVQMLIHGGYWRSLDKSDFSDKAAALQAAGIATFVVNYSLCPKATVGDIVAEMRRALAWVWRHAPEYGGDRARIQIAGHSAGAHLAAMLLATDWPAFAPDLPAQPIQSAVLSSGIYDLAPMLHASMNVDLHLDAASAEALSPILLKPRCRVAVAASWGALESDEFKRQTRDFAAAWKSQGIRIETSEIPGRHHLDVMDEMSRPDGILLKTSRRLLGLI